jgi:hypothetical protein
MLARTSLFVRELLAYAGASLIGESGGGDTGVFGEEIDEIFHPAVIEKEGVEPECLSNAFGFDRSRP